jgi:hypothetical protein
MVLPFRSPDSPTTGSPDLSPPPCPSSRIPKDFYFTIPSHPSRFRFSDFGDDVRFRRWSAIAALCAAPSPYPSSRIPKDLHGSIPGHPSRFRFSDFGDGRAIFGDVGDSRALRGPPPPARHLGFQRTYTGPSQNIPFGVDFRGSFAILGVLCGETGLGFSG